MHEHVHKGLDVKFMSKLPKYPRVIKVIVSEVLRGKGTNKSPCRGVTQYHDLDGVFLAEYDASHDRTVNGSKVGEYVPHLEQRGIE